MALALYRKYRPATFAQVVGQEHVTDPLRTALAAGRVNHAYLFSGPRGCGKTSSARILARSLNCVQGPTDEPCGECNSCIALAPNGPGSVDVIELDAASHGGVDDARELRDKAFYAPAESRYRVFIVDEAHMVTTQGFNALLKIVEEPPEHLVFIFATTEPDKVLPTIRSRTHHYPFRLIPPTAMRDLLERNCAAEGIAVEPAVFPLVIRAGGGSARDTQSVLDQLLAGAGPEGVTYARAVSLLGVTDVSLLDDIVDGLAASDGATVFGTVERVVEAGHDPRRFASDLLDRFRDLVLLQAVPDAGERGLITAPADEVARMDDQARKLGQATVTRYAEIVHAGLTEMRGATAPRLLLELVCSRMMLPSSSDTESAVLQRVERLERRLTAAAGSAPAPALADSGESTVDSSPPRFQRPSQRAAAAERTADAAPSSPPAGSAASATEGGRANSGSAGSAAPADGARMDGGAATEAARTEGGPADAARAEGGPSAEAARAEGGQRPAGAARTDSSRRPAAAGAQPAAEARSADAQRPAAEAARSSAEGQHQGADDSRSPADDTQPAADARPAAEATQPAADSRPADSRPAEPPRAPAAEAARPAAEPQQAPAAELPPDVPSAPATDGTLDAAAIRRVWSEVLSAVRASSRSVEAMLSAATVQSVDGNTVTLTHTAAPLVKRLSENRNVEVVANALQTMLGGEWQIHWTHGGQPAAAPPPAPKKAPPKFEVPRRAQQAAPTQAAPQEPTDPPSPSPDSSQDDDEIPPPPEPMDDEDMLAEASRPLTDEERANQRTPEDAAIDLLSEHLGARKIDR